jgi:hypothetical protein
LASWREIVYSFMPTMAIVLTRILRRKLERAQGEANAIEMDTEILPYSS